MNTNIFKLIMAIIALFFAVATTNAQQAETMYIMKNGKATHEIAISDIDSITFYNPFPDSVEINGVVWATRNVGAPGTFVGNPEDFGMYYQWNSTVGWNSTIPPVSIPNGSVWNSSWTGNGATTWETTNNICPAGYRVPTYAEIQSLTSAGSQWTTINGVNGRIFGSGDNTIFLPAAGDRDYNKLYAVGTTGEYWSSDGGTALSSRALTLPFENTGVFYLNALRWAGLPVRCVAE